MIRIGEPLAGDRRGCSRSPSPAARWRASVRAVRAGRRPPARSGQPASCRAAAAAAPRRASGGGMTSSTTAPATARPRPAAAAAGVAEQHPVADVQRHWISEAEPGRAGAERPHPGNDAGRADVQRDRPGKLAGRCAISCLVPGQPGGAAWLAPAPLTPGPAATSASALPGCVSPVIRTSIWSVSVQRPACTRAMPRCNASLLMPRRLSATRATPDAVSTRLAERLQVAYPDRTHRRGDHELVAPVHGPGRERAGDDGAAAGHAERPVDPDPDRAAGIRLGQAVRQLVQGPRQLRDARAGHRS